MKNQEVDEDNWEEKQKGLDSLYRLIPDDTKELVTKIVTLELELENISNR